MAADRVDIVALVRVAVWAVAHKATVQHQEHAKAHEQYNQMHYSRLSDPSHVASFQGAASNFRSFRC